MDSGERGANDKSEDERDHAATAGATLRPSRGGERCLHRECPRDLSTDRAGRAARPLLPEHDMRAPVEGTSSHRLARSPSELRPRLPSSARCLGWKGPARTSPQQEAPGCTRWIRSRTCVTCSACCPAGPDSGGSRSLPPIGSRPSSSPKLSRSWLPTARHGHDRDSLPLSMGAHERKPTASQPLPSTVREWIRSNTDRSSTFIVDPTWPFKRVGPAIVGAVEPDVVDYGGTLVFDAVRTSLAGRATGSASETLGDVRQVLRTLGGALVGQKLVASDEGDG